MAEPITVAVRRGDIVEARAHRPCGCGQGRRSRRGSGRRRARHLHAFGGEADPGAAGRPCEARPRRPRARDRVRLASRRPAADRRRPLAARQGARPGGRARVRRRGRAAQRRSGTTARESTPGSWLSAAPAGGTRAATGLPDHPVQQAMLAEVAAAADLREGEIPTAIDGCGVVNFALPLERMAYAFSRFTELDGGRARRRRDARPPGADSRPGRAGHRADGIPARLDREGRRRRAAVRRRPGRASASRSRSRTEARGQSARRSRRFSAGSAIRSTNSPRHRSRTAAAEIVGEIRAD